MKTILARFKPFTSATAHRMTRSLNLNVLTTPVITAVALLCASLANAGGHAGEYFYTTARVVDVTPMYEYHRTYPSHSSHQPHYGNDQRCKIKHVEVHNTHRDSGAVGAIIGGAIGAHIGSSIGDSREATAVGAIAGSVLGGAVGQQQSSSVHYRVGQDCYQRPTHHSQGYEKPYREYRELIGYKVRYRYNGREFSMTTHEHPGRTVRIRVEVQPNRR